MIKHKENNSDLIQQLIDLIQQYNYTRELSTNLTGNFNRIDPPAPVERGVGVGVGKPYKLYHQFSDSDNNFSKL